MGSPYVITYWDAKQGTEKTVGLDGVDAAKLQQQRPKESATLTFFDDGNLELNLPAMRRHARFLLEGGVKAAVILDGRIPHVLLLELFTEPGAGTMITRE